MYVWIERTCVRVCVRAREKESEIEKERERERERERDLLWCLVAITAFFYVPLC